VGTVRTPVGAVTGVALFALRIAFSAVSSVVLSAFHVVTALLNSPQPVANTARMGSLGDMSPRSRRFSWRMRPAFTAAKLGGGGGPAAPRPPPPAPRPRPALGLPPTMASLASYALAA